MPLRSLHGVMIIVGLASVVAVLAYGLLAVNAAPEASPTFWLFAAIFIGFIAWDLTRHLRAIRSQRSVIRNRIR